MGSLQNEVPASISFFEAAPENWLGVGGRLGDAFANVCAKRPLACHGLLLNLGGPDPLDSAFLQRLKAFLDQHCALIYSDHLSFCADQGHLYELLPLPFTRSMVKHVAARIRQVQDVLERRIAIENASYYLSLSNEMDELEFINEVLERADCDLLIDINNIYVNSVNHRYDPREFLSGLPGERIAYAHIAGHSHDAPDLIVDTHGASVVDDVWQLLEFAYSRFGVFPTLLERDLNIPALTELLPEVERIEQIQHKFLHATSSAA